MSDTTETRTERWRYLGRRESSNGRLGALYQTTDVAADSLRRAEAKARSKSSDRFAGVMLGEPRDLYKRTPHPRRAALLAQAIRLITAT